MSEGKASRALRPADAREQKSCSGPHQAAGGAVGAVAGGDQAAQAQESQVQVGGKPALHQVTLGVTSTSKGLVSTFAISQMLKDRGPYLSVGLRNGL